MECSLKVLLMPSPPPGRKIENGQDRYLDSLVKGMGGRVDFIGLDDPQFARGPDKKWEPGIEQSEARPCHIFVRLIPRSIRLLLGYSRDAWRLSRLLRPYCSKVDLIHVNRVGCEIQPIAAKLAGFHKIVTTIHNLPGEAEKNSWVCRWVERLSFACGDVHIAVSEATYEAWHARVGLKKVVELSGCQVVKGEAEGSITQRGKCVTIYNGMKPEDLTGFDRRAYRQKFCDEPDHTFIVGICARLHRMKGHVVLLEAFAILLKEFEQKPAKSAKGRELVSAGGGEATVSSRALRASVQTLDYLQSEFPSCLLLIAGDGPEEASIKAKITELGIGDHVRLLGHRNDAERFAGSLDLNVLPSVALETLGYSVVEAMFGGVPSVVSDVGGMKELIALSGGGAVVPAGDAGALQVAISAYVNDPERRQREGSAGRSFALKHLTATNMANATLNAYELLKRSE
jgi:glycosyltransferase involved in cell wall biosynthesis